jgi:glucose dehydrogenase
MRRKSSGRPGLTAALLAIALVVACGVATPAAAARRGAGVPPEVRRHADDWPLPGRDYRNSRATTHSSIDSGSISRLELAWEVPLPGTGAYGNASTTPLIVGDTVYVQDLTGTVRAIDRATGAVRWQADQRNLLVGPNGVAVGWGMVFANDGSSGVVALDAASGEVRWRKTVVTTPSEGIDIQPTVFGNRVLVSTVPISIRGIYRGGDRGMIHALDAATGRTAWTFDTIESPDLWGRPDINSGGGAWYPPAIDPARRLVYWGIANPAPFPGTPEFPNGASRPGPNLYTESVVALTLRRGRLRWYHQATPHDIFDHDLIHTLLVDGRIRGHRRRMLVATGKGGHVLGLHPRTGRLRWSTPVGVHVNDDLTALTGPTDVLPGTFGGVLTPPAAANGVVYVAAINAPTTLLPDSPAYFGSRLGTMDGDVVALDAATGRIRWDTKVPGDPIGAATVVNDLVITSTFTGELLALDRATGGIVWRYQAPGGINGWPAVAGDLLVVPVGLAQPPRLLALRVAAHATTTTTVPAGSTTTTIPATVSLAQHVQPIFDRHCVACHQGSRSPDLRAGSAHRTLVDVGSSECGAVKLVAPGSPSTSYLVDKLRGRATGCFVGSAMPPGSPLNAAERDLIATWIRQGALDN